MPRKRRRSVRSRGRKVVCDPGILGGKPIVEGTRMSVEQILGLLANGMSIADIVHSYPHLTPADVRAAVSFALEAVRDDIVVEVSR